MNWRPFIDYELREIEFDRREVEYKQRMQHQFEPTPEHTQQLRGLIGFLLEYGEFA